MGFGENITFLRKMHKQMSQEELAEKMGVSRQTVSKWEQNACYPEMNKTIELCEFFSCSLDDLIKNDMNVCDEAFSNIRVEELEPFRYIRYNVVSMEPECDANEHANNWAKTLNIENPMIVGWDFPIVSQEQINLYYMHGYTTALILPDEIKSEDIKLSEVIMQSKQSYVAITIKDPFVAPFHVIPNAYKTLLYHIQVNQLSAGEPANVIPCFEKTYEKDGTTYMDVYIAIRKK